MKKSFLLFGLLTISSMAFSQELLDTVTVTANRAQGPLQTATRTVDVLTAKDIKNTPATTVNETLENVSALDVRQRGPLDMQADVSLRGGTFDQTLVLLNGIRMNDPQTGHHNMNLPISFDIIDKIEVLEGGASRVYGPNAFAGAINLQTPTSGKNQLAVHVLGGQYGLLQLNTNATFNTGNWFHLVSGSLAKSNGYIANTDFKSSNFLVQSSGALNIGMLSFTAGRNAKAFGAQNFYSSRYPEQFEATETIFGSAKLTGGSVWKYTALAYWRQHKDRFELFRETDGPYEFTNGFFVKNQNDTAKYVPGVFAAWNYYPGHNYHRTRVTGAEGQLKRTFTHAGTTTIGFDYRNEQIVSNNLGKPIAEPIAIANARGSYTKTDARDNYALYAEHAATLKNFFVTAGFLYNYNSAFGNDFMPGIDLGYRANHHWLIYASVDRSFRLPTFTDLYYSLGGAQGSASLQPEYSLNYEVGSRFTQGNFTTNVSLFRREGKNMIDWVQWTADSIHAENLTEVNINGISLTAKWELAQHTNGWITNIDAGYTFLMSEQDETDLQSLYVLDYLTHKLYVGLTHTLYLTNLEFNWRLRYQARNGTYLDYPTNTVVNYQPFILVDARVSYTLEQIKLYVQASNLFNVDYVDRGNVAQPGLWISGGLNWTLSFNK